MSDTKRMRVPQLQECPCSGRNLDKLIQPAALAILAEGPLHGYRLVQRLGRLPMFKGHEPDTSGVYRFLAGMEKRGLVASTWDVSDRGPARKLFRLTARGTKCLGLWATTLAEYQQQLGYLLRNIRRATRRHRGKRAGLVKES